MIQDSLALPIEKLTTERERILLKLTDLGQELSAHVDPADPEDLASDLVEHEMALSRIQELENRLKVIDEALQKVSQGTYGICERCGESIDPARLEVVPETTLCIGCKTVGERPTKVKNDLPESVWAEEWRVRKLTFDKLSPFQPYDFDEDS
jgi:DnaK suppressor protein